MSLMQEMSQRALDLGVPMSVHFDITYRCNERCVHCYLDHDDHGEMTTSEDQARAERTGGRRHIFPDLQRRRSTDAARFLRTSGICAQPDVRRENQDQRRHDREAEARRMLELGVDQIQVSIYSHRPEVHDAITKLPGSLRRSIEAIRFLTRARTEGVDCQCLDDANMHEHAGVQAWPASWAFSTRWTRPSRQRWMATPPS